MAQAERHHRKSARERLHVHIRQQEAMASLSQMALSESDLSALLNHAADRIANALQVEIVRVLEFQPEKNLLVVRVGGGVEDPSNLNAAISAGIDTQAGFTLAAGEPVVMTDSATEKRFSVPSDIRDLGIISGVTVIIPGQPHHYGILAVHTTEQRVFNSDEVYFIRSVANVLGVAIAEARATQALKGSESRMRAVVNNAVDGIITIDEQGIMESANPAAERLFGYSVDEMVGHNVSMLMPQPYQRQHDAYIQSYISTGIAKIIGIGREVIGKRKDGTMFPMELAVSEFRMGDRRMFAGTVRDISERRQLERQILETAAGEQRRIGHDLHDGLCQQLAGIAFATEVHLQKLRGRSAAEASTVEKIAKMIDDSITQARQLARGLQPVSLDAGGLVSALRELAAKVEEMFRVTCMFECEQMVLVPDNVTATHLYRIAQEATNNAIKHGRAHMLMIELAEESGAIRLIIRDNGVGLGKTHGDGRGIGLQSMAYRARMIGGNFEIHSGPQGGTVASCVVPLSALGLDGDKYANKERGEEDEKAPARGLQISLDAVADSGPTKRQRSNRNRSGEPSRKQKTRARGRRSSDRS